MQTQQTSKVAVLQMSTQANVEENLAQAEHLIRQATEQGAQLAVLPEVFACYDSNKYLAIAAQEITEDGLIRSSLAQWAKQYQVYVVAGTLPIFPDDSASSLKVFSRCFLYDQQGLEVCHYDKIHLFDVDVADKQQSYRESNLFMPGNQVQVVDTPFGKIGMTICYDLRFPLLFQAMRDQGAEIFVVPAAFTYKTGEAHWKSLLQARAIEHQCYVLAANQCGWHDEKRKTYGHSMIIDAWGEVQAKLEDQVGVAIADIDLSSLASIRAAMPVAEHKKPSNDEFQLEGFS